MRLIETTHLKTWAASKPAESRLPYLIKKLICAVIQPKKIRFPSGDAVWIPGFDGGAMHTGLLWGLETIAWIPDYLPQIALILARLASLDTGGRLLNRPINSLHEIFLWWHPCTNAPIDRRLAALDLILSREPVVGWELLAKLLPNATPSISHPTVKPRWRDFGDLPEESRTGRGQLIYLSEIVDRSLEHVGSDPLRWQAVLESIRVISTEQQEKALANLNDIGKSEAIDNEK